MDFSSFLTSLGTSFVIFVVLMLVFTWLSRKPGNEEVYYPNRILRGLDPWEGRRRTRNPVAWIKEAVGATEGDVIAAAGVDTAVYLVFLSSVLGILVFSGIILLPVLLPVAVTDHNLKLTAQEISNGPRANYTSLDKLAMGNIQPKSSRLWAFLLATYWVSFVTFYVLWNAYKHVSDMRSSAKGSLDAKPEDFTILVRDIPAASQNQSRKEQVDSYFKALHPETFYKSMVVTDNKKPKSSRLWAFLLATYWVSFVTFYVLWNAYKHVSDMRSSAKGSLDAKPEDFTILVRDIPAASQNQSRKEQVDSYFKELHPETFYKSMVVTDNKKANKLWVELEGYKKKLAHAEAVYEGSKTTSKPDGTRPTNRTGFLGLVGQKVDTIDYCNEKMKELLPKLEAEQKVTLREKQQSAALVFFNARPAAAVASQTIHAQITDTWTIKEAPEPRDVVWENLPKKSYERLTRQTIIYIIVFLTVVFYMIPIAFISAFTTLDNLRRLLPFLKKVVEQKVVKTVLEAYLPQIALIVFLALLPMFLMILSKAEGIPARSHVIRAASGKYFYFNAFNVFLGVTIGGTLFSSLKTILKEPKKIVSLLGENLPGNATFFLTFVALKFFVGYGLELSRLVPLVIFHLKKKYLCKTEAEVKEAWSPGDLNYATRIPNDMLIVIITLCYSVIAPLIIPFSVVYFGLGWLIARNQALKVYAPSYESYGRMWPHMHARILSSLVIYQITMFGYFGLKKFVYAPFVLPVIIMSFIYAYVSKSRFYPAFCCTPLEVARQELKEVPNLESIYLAYIPPCLKPENPEDIDQFEDAQSQVSKATSI